MGIVGYRIYKERGWNIKFVWTYTAYAHMCLFIRYIKGKYQGYLCTNFYWSLPLFEKNFNDWIINTAISH